MKSSTAARKNTVEQAANMPVRPMSLFIQPVRKTPIPPAVVESVLPKPSAVDLKQGGTTSQRAGFSLASPSPRTNEKTDTVAITQPNPGLVINTSNSGAAAP